MANLGLLAVVLTALVSRASAVCNPVTSALSTQVKIDSGQSGTAGTNCYFPFSYSGTTYTDCTGPYCTGTYCNYWCATSCNYGSDGLWNYCKYRLSDLTNTNCSGLTGVAASAEPALLYGGAGTGSTCYFPFLYSGVCYYDCVSTSAAGDPWCATTDVATKVSTNYKYCRYTLAGKNHPSCASIASSASYYLPPQVGNYSITGVLQNDQYGNCSFPFYYNGMCFDDCTTVGAAKWYLIWCSTEQYYLPNKKTRVCPYYRKYQTYTGLALSWGFYRVYLNDGCGSGGPFCNLSLSKAGSGVPNGAFGSPRIVLSSTPDVIEVMPQGNGYFILRLPLPCATNFLCVTTDSSDVVYDYVNIEREFWNIQPAVTSGMFTIQSTWNTTAGYYFTRVASSGYQVAKIDSSISSEWRFEQLTSAELSSLGLPCENTTTTVAGTWCAWSAYTYASGAATRSRSCNCPPASGGGATCVGNSTESGATVNGTWCAWSSYTVAAAYGTRTRDCNCSAAAYGGVDCAGSGNDTGLVVNADWCAWSSYTTVGSYGTRTRNCSCPTAAYGGSSSCAGSSNDTGLTADGTWCAWSGYTANGAYGTRTRSCNCSAPAYGGLNCAGSSNDTGAVVNGTWCAWSSFTTSGAYATRTRSCSCPAEAYGGSSCSGTSNDTGLTVDGTWCAWSGYTTSGAYGTRTRDCNCSAPAYAGLSCVGSSNDTGAVVNGTWCAWSGYTVTAGYATRLRVCNCPADAYGGQGCQGTTNDTGTVTNGNWCSWSAYTVTAGVGTRTRNCSCPDPAYTGASCSGNTTDSLAQVNGSWCSWSSLASGYGVLTRARLCNCSAPNAVGQNCSGSDAESYPCNVTSCQTTTPAAVDGAWCAWGSWVAGNMNSGIMTRTRSCGCPAASGTGTACSGSTGDSATCTLTGCRVYYAVPAESGVTGASFASTDTYNRLVIWGSVIGGSIFISGIVGMALMFRQIATGGV